MEGIVMYIQKKSIGLIQRKIHWIHPERHSVLKRTTALLCIAKSDRESYLKIKMIPLSNMFYSARFKYRLGHWKFGFISDCQMNTYQGDRGYAI